MWEKSFTCIQFIGFYHNVEKTFPVLLQTVCKIIKLKLLRFIENPWKTTKLFSCVTFIIYGIILIHTYPTIMSIYNLQRLSKIFEASVFLTILCSLATDIHLSEANHIMFPSNNKTVRHACKVLSTTWNDI